MSDSQREGLPRNSELQQNSEIERRVSHLKSNNEPSITCALSGRKEGQKEKREKKGPGGRKGKRDVKQNATGNYELIKTQLASAGGKEREKEAEEFYNNTIYHYFVPVDPNPPSPLSESVSSSTSTTFTSYIGFITI